MSYHTEIECCPHSTTKLDGRLVGEGRRGGRKGRTVIEIAETVCPGGRYPSLGQLRSAERIERLLPHPVSRRRHGGTR